MKFYSRQQQLSQELNRENGKFNRKRSRISEYSNALYNSKVEFDVIWAHSFMTGISQYKIHELLELPRLSLLCVACQENLRRAY